MRAKWYEFCMSPLHGPTPLSRISRPAGTACKGTGGHVQTGLPFPPVSSTSDGTTWIASGLASDIERWANECARQIAIAFEVPLEVVFGNTPKGCGP